MSRARDGTVHPRTRDPTANSRARRLRRDAPVAAPVISSAHRTLPFAGRTALVAEDDLELRAVLVEMLAADGFEVAAVADGEELVTALAMAARGLLRVDVVITDLTMPRVGGLEVLARTRGWAERPPVVVITAFPSRDTERRVRALGALGPIAKPFDLADLRTVVWHACRPD